MTALERARGWFIAPPEAASDDESAWCAFGPPVTDDDGFGEAHQSTGLVVAPGEDASPGEASQSGYRFSSTPLRTPTPARPAWQPPQARVSGPGEQAAIPGPSVDGPTPRPSGASPAGPAVHADGIAARRTWRPPVPETERRVEPPSASPPVAADAPAAEPVDAREVTSAADAPVAEPVDAREVTSAADAPVAEPVDAREVTSAADVPAAEPVDAREVTSAAVLGRPGEVEPVAAALALALRRETRAATATVGLVGAALPEHAEGGRARRLGERLAQHGFEVRVRGRLAWVQLDPADGQLAAAARRLALVGAPAVLAVSAPRNADMDSALLECDLLLVVASDPEGPLASLAASGLADVPVVTVRPLARGPARALARAGVRATRSARQLLSIDKERP